MLFLSKLVPLDTDFRLIYGKSKMYKIPKYYLTLIVVTSSWYILFSINGSCRCKNPFATITSHSKLALKHSGICPAGKKGKKRFIPAMKGGPEAKIFMAYFC